jgi:hypothetical protein
MATPRALRKSALPVFGRPSFGRGRPGGKPATGDERGLADGHDAVLGALAGDAHERGLGVDGLDLEAAEFRRCAGRSRT